MESIEVVHKIKNRFFSSNTYIFTFKGAQDCIIIDPGVDFESIHMSIENFSLSPIGIICTHGHFDHLGSVSQIMKAYGTLSYALHEKDLRLAKSANFFAKLAKLNVYIEFVQPNFILTGTSGAIEFGDYRLRYENFPGHSDGSCVISTRDLLFGGDLIYRKGVGFNNFPGENKVALKQSILTLYEKYDPRLMVYPGHGESETLAIIREKNLELNKFLG